MLGHLPPGSGWTTRNDNFFSNPTPLEQFTTDNLAYAKQMAETRASSEHWQTMLDEVLLEHSMGRIEGPFELPTDWQVTRAEVMGHHGPMPTTPLPPGAHHIAMAFPIIQIGSDGQDKVRRGEDWRRSGHNSTVHVTDSPRHHTVDHYFDLAAHLHRHQHTQNSLRGFLVRQGPRKHCSCGDTTTRVHTGSCHWRTPTKPTCCCTHHKELPCGDTTYSSSEQWHRCGATTGLGTH